jgi:hypothetical protein
MGAIKSECLGDFVGSGITLQAQGHAVSHTLVGELLKDRGFSLQGNRKTTEGTNHPDRDA